jgi:hypothetical protein
LEESYYLGAYWGLRRESVEACATRLSRHLGCLAQCDPLFSDWFLQGRTRRDASNRKIDTDPQTLAIWLAKGVSRTNTGHATMAELGFHMGLWTGGRSNADSASLMLNCGCYSAAVGMNSCLLELPHGRAVADRLFESSSLIALMSCAVASWDPDWALVSSIELDRAMPAQLGNAPRLGWLLYLADRLGTIPALPSQALVTEMGDSGSLVAITASRFSAQDTSRVQAAKALLTRLNEAGLLKPLPQAGSSGDS